MSINSENKTANFDVVLKMLDSSGGRYVSGESIAEKLNISRAAVCKIVNGLREVGYKIDAKNKLGYCFSDDNFLINKHEIEEGLSDTDYHLTFLYETDSTNNYAKRLAIQGADEKTLVVSLCQTGGKGRRGRQFLSPAGDGIYFSVVLRPTVSARDSLLITTSAALAVSRAIEKNTGKGTQIKWVNDVYIDNKKCCGILTEASLDVENNSLDYAILGIGINVYTPDGGYDESIKDIATSVSTEKRTSKLTADLLTDTLKEFDKIYSNMAEKKHLDEYRKKCCCIGRDVLVIRNSKSETAHCVDINDDYSLRVRYDDSTEENLNSGEVSLVLK